MKKNTATITQGPGRPKYTPAYPRKKMWTFTDLEDSNGVNPRTGKGKFCTTLTLRKFLARDMFLTIESGKNKGKPNRNAPNPDSTVVLMEDLQASSNSTKGLGRKQYVYILRAKLDAKTAKTAAAPAAPKATRKPRKAAVTVDVSTAATDYEATKAALLAPEAVTVPAVTVTPTPEPVATPAPVAETPAPAEVAAPAPEAQAAEVAAVATEATAPTTAS